MLTVVDHLYLNLPFSNIKQSHAICKSVGVSEKDWDIKRQVSFKLRNTTLKPRRGSQSASWGFKAYQANHTDSYIWWTLMENNVLLQSLPVDSLQKLWRVLIDQQGVKNSLWQQRPSCPSCGTAYRSQGCSSCLAQLMLCWVVLLYLWSRRIKQTNLKEPFLIYCCSTKNDVNTLSDQA
jgi:hypothetical protein